MTRVLVCGGRSYDDRDNVFVVLDALNSEHQFSLVIHGGAKGADFLAGEWAAVRRVPAQVFAAEWGRYGNRAGPIRNRQMLVVGKPDLLVAFPGDLGTENMMVQADRYGVPICRISRSGDVE